jgi:pimeloyl-ACP methyl ester carboxylesterase
MPATQVGLQTIYYDEYGAGEPLILIPGLGGSRLGWTKQIAPFSEKYRVINLDNRDVQIKASVARSETNPSRKTKLELSLAGTHQEIADFIAQLVKSYHYSN